MHITDAYATLLNTRRAPLHILCTDTTYTPTGITQVNNTNIKYVVAPNPAEDHIYIYMDKDNMNNVKGCLYTVDGRLVRTIENMQPSIPYAMDVTELAAGTYILSFSGSGKTVTEKIVKK